MGTPGGHPRAGGECVCARTHACACVRVSARFNLLPACPKGEPGSSQEPAQKGHICLKLLWVSLTLSTQATSPQAQRLSQSLRRCPALGGGQRDWQCARAFTMVGCLCGSHGSHQPRICICEREAPPGAGPSSVSLVTPGCPGDISGSCASHAGPGD